MPADNVPIYAFNRGLISRLGLARQDVKRMALSSSIHTNWMPRVLGSMMLRPGWRYTGGQYLNRKAKHIPFIYSSTDKAIIEMTDSVMRIKLDEVPITRAAVSTVTTNGNFTSNVTGWTDADEVGTSSGWGTGGFMFLLGTRYNYAIRKQTLSVALADRPVQHALSIIVTRGKLTLRVGTSDGGDQLIRETVLTEGRHSIAFTPNAASVFVYLASNTTYATLVDSVNIEAAGDLALTTPYAEADLPYLRWDQSADVVYITCKGKQQHKIERRGPRSWSIVKYLPEDGPFRVANFTPLTLTPSDINGSITITASKNFFRSTHVGGLFKLTSASQTVEQSLAGDGQATDYVRVIGTGNQRLVNVSLAGTWVGTVTLQRSLGDPGAWTDVANYTANFAPVNYNDNLPNQVAYYRFAIKAGNYTSGSVDATLIQASGSIDGIVRITGFTSELLVNADVIKSLGSTGATENWNEGEWSDFRGYPSAVALYEGRLWFAGKAKIIGSVSDAYESFDADTEGDSGPINRSIGSGPVDDINWLIALQRLLAGTDIREVSVRSSSFDEPLTPSNFGLKDASTQGSAPLSPVKVDIKGMFINKSLNQIFQLDMDSSGTYYDYQSTNLTELVPEIGETLFKGLAVQRQPDTRVHAWRGDGKVAILISQPAEEVLCWIEVETDGVVEDIFTLPDTKEDKVYYSVARQVNGSTVRYLECWAQESECRGDLLNKQADSFIVYDGAPTATITGLGHLEGCEVIVWADGRDFSPTDEDTFVQTVYTVTSGAITLPEPVSKAVIGLPYMADYQSVKLAYAAGGSTALTRKKRVDHLGLILADTHARGLLFGPDFDDMESLPLVEDGAVVDPDSIWAAYDKEGIEFTGAWDTDGRICLRAQAPRPCTVLAAIISMKTNG